MTTEEAKPATVTRTIRGGCSFVTTDAEGKPVTLTGGQEIELAPDVAALHADKLEPLQTSAQPDAA